MALIINYKIMRKELKELTNLERKCLKLGLKTMNNAQSIEENAMVNPAKAYLLRKRFTNDKMDCFRQAMSATGASYLKKNEATTAIRAYLEKKKQLAS